LARKRKKSKAKVEPKETGPTEAATPSGAEAATPSGATKQSGAAKPSRADAKSKKKKKKKVESKETGPTEAATPSGAANQSGAAEPSRADAKPKKKKKKKSKAKKKTTGKKAPAGKKVSAKTKDVSTPEADADAGPKVTDLDAQAPDSETEIIDPDTEAYDVDEVDDGPTLEELVAAAGALDGDDDGTPDVGESIEDEVNAEDLDAGFGKLDASEMDGVRDQVVAEALAFVDQEETDRVDSDSAPATGAAAALLAIERDARAPEGEDDVIAPEGEDDDVNLDVVKLDVVELGEVSTPEARDRLLAATLAHAAMQEAVYRVPMDTGETRRWKGMIASTIFFFAAVAALSPPGLLVPDAPAQLTVADHLYGVRITLLLQAEQVEAFRVRTQRLPDSLADLAATFPGVRFVKSSNRLYQLLAYTPDGVAVVYDSSTPAPEFQTISRVFSLNEAGG